MSRDLDRAALTRCELAFVARQWFRGLHMLPGTNRRVWISNRPDSEQQRMAQLAEAQDVLPDYFQTIGGDDHVEPR